MTAQKVPAFVQQLIRLVAHSYFLIGTSWLLCALIDCNVEARYDASQGLTWLFIGAIIILGVLTYTDLVLFRVGPENPLSRAGHHCALTPTAPCHVTTRGDAIQIKLAVGPTDTRSAGWFLNSSPFVITRTDWQTHW